MAEDKQILLGGFGGQGIVLAGVILGYAAINDGKWVAGSNSYGAAARGGACQAGVVIGDEPVAFPHVTQADIFVAMFQEAYDKFIDHVSHDGGIVIYDEQFVVPGEVSGVKYIGIPATRSAIEQVNNRMVANVIMLGALVGVTGVVTEKALVSAIRENSPKRFQESNLKAVNIGFELGKVRS